jgi:hypothetical protein
MTKGEADRDHSRPLGFSVEDLPSLSDGTRRPSTSGTSDSEPKPEARSPKPEAKPRSR